MFELNKNGDYFLFTDEFILSEDPELNSFYSAPVTLLGRAERHELETHNQFLLCKTWFKYQVDWKKISGEPIPGTSLIQIGACSGPELDCIITCVAISPSAGAVDSLVTNRWVSNQNDVSNWHKSLRATFSTINRDELSEEKVLQ